MITDTAQPQRPFLWRSVWLDSRGNLDEQVIAFSMFCFGVWALTVWNILHAQPVSVTDFATANATIAGACGLCTGFNRWVGA